jgi:hypothetical protein
MTHLVNRQCRPIHIHSRGAEQEADDASLRNTSQLWSVPSAFQTVLLLSDLRLVTSRMQIGVIMICSPSLVQ